MSSNKYKPHIIVLPEDEANRQIALGFELHQHLNPRVIQILPVIGGWLKVVEEFITAYVPSMQEYKDRNVVLLIDFDEQNDRSKHIKNQIPAEIQDRVFILGVFSEPEALKRKVGKNLEEIGKALADDCKDQTEILWGHELLKHNKAELDRVNKLFRQYLF